VNQQVKPEERPTKWLSQFSLPNSGYYSYKEYTSEFRRGEGTQKQECKQRPNEINSWEAGLWIVKTTETLRLAPRVKVIGRMVTPKCRASPELVCIESAQLPLQGVLVARRLSQVGTKAAEQARQQ